MKTFRRFLMVMGAVLAIVAPSAFAEYLASASSPAQQAIMNVNNSLSLFYPTARFNYGEPSDASALDPSTSLGDPYLDAENGYLHGFGFSLAGMESSQKLYIRTSYQLVTGPVSYVGTCTPGPTPCQGTSLARIGDGAFRLGKGFVAGEQVMLAPFVELGSHFWQRDLDATQHESYQHRYWSVGGMFQYAPISLANGMGLVVTADLSVGKIFDSMINVPGLLQNAPLGQKPIIQTGLDLDWHATPFLSLFTGFHYTYFSYGQSPIQNGALEPISYTQFYTFFTGLRISFANIFYR